MERKYLTELFPWLRPLRLRQRKFFYYAGMRLDKRLYALHREAERLPVELFSSACPMYNPATGFAMVYQENKVFNLKLAAATLDGLHIRPGETFSFWRLVKDAQREQPYKAGLAEVNGRLVIEKGGGLCQLSNLLCWVLLHTPLTVAERHGHRKKDFPEPQSDAPMGVDAAVAEGWLDLRFYNDTADTFQIGVSFTKTHICAAVYTERDRGIRWQVDNRQLHYYRRQEEIWEETDVVRRACRTDTGELLEECLLYQNRCRIGYKLSEGTPVEERS
ncbi:MAG: VanW family protein [Eubacteriales bacterium]|nr:VanW family protein [Eubacteriales bacterium]